MRTIAGSILRTVRAVKLLATDGRIPRPLRGLVVLGAMPIPGPLDEAVLLVAAVPLLVFYRPLLRDAWQRAAPPSLGGPSQSRKDRGSR